MTTTPPRSRKEARTHIEPRDDTPTTASVPTPVEPSAEDAAAARRAKIEPIARIAAIFIMPAIIVGMMITGYLSTMHAPTPHDMPIAIAGDSSAVSSIADALQEDNPDAVAVTIVDSAQKAKDLVIRREAAAAVSITGNAATVSTAMAAGAGQAGIATGLVTPALIADGLTITSEDLAPLPDNDPSGLGAVFMASALVMAGYMPFSTLRSNSPELLRFRRIVPLLAGWAALIAGLVWVVTGPIMGIVTGDHSAAVLGVAWLGAFSISCMQLFITRLFGPLGVIVGMFFLMVLGMPASNMSASLYTMPGFYRFLHEFLPMGAIGESLRSVLYFDGIGLPRHLLVLAIGAVAGLAATAIFDRTRGRRYPDGVAMNVNMPSLHGGRRPKNNFWRYLSLAFFPFAMVTMMLSCMLGAMHQPSPRDMPVAIVGSSVDQAEQAAAGISENMAGMFELTPHAPADTDELREQVEDRAITAALVLPTQDNPEYTLIANQAGSPSAYQVAVRVFTQLAESQNTPLTVDDTAALPGSDSNGVVPMYMAMGWMLAGFMVVVVAANAAPSTRPLRRMLPLTAVYAVAMSALLWLIGGPITGAFDGHFLAIWGAGIAAIFSVSMFAMLFERLLGMLSIIPVMGVLMFLGVPSSNGAISVYMTPDAFRTLHDLLPMPAAVETIRSLLYFGGDVAAENLQVLGLWGLVSLALVFVVDSLKRVRTEHDFGELLTPANGGPQPLTGPAHETKDEAAAGAPDDEQEEEASGATAESGEPRHDDAERRLPVGV